MSLSHGMSMLRGPSGSMQMGQPMMMPAMGQPMMTQQPAQQDGGRRAPKPRAPDGRLFCNHHPNCTFQNCKYAHVTKAIKEEGSMSDKIKEDLSEALKDFKRTFDA